MYFILLTYLPLSCNTYNKRENAEPIYCDCPLLSESNLIKWKQDSLAKNDFRLNFAYELKKKCNFINKKFDCLINYLGIPDGKVDSMIQTVDTFFTIYTYKLRIYSSEGSYDNAGDRWLDVSVFYVDSLIHDIRLGYGE